MAWCAVVYSVLSAVALFDQPCLVRRMNKWKCCSLLVSSLTCIGGLLVSLGVNQWAVLIVLPVLIVPLFAYTCFVHYRAYGFSCYFVDRAALAGEQNEEEDVENGRVAQNEASAEDKKTD